MKILSSVSEVDASAWNSLIDVAAQPFVRHEWLAALEESGCASAETGWTPAHITISRGNELIAAAPAYVKTDSEGDFSRDWGMADAAIRARIPYYPKLVVGVPFTPVSGQRLLIRPEHRAEYLPQLAEAMVKAAEKLGARSIQILFPLADEALALETLGMVRRVAFQYHWRNEGYTSPEDFLACLDSKKRNQARRERKEPAAQGITIRTIRGAEMLADAKRWGRSAFALHRSTVDKLMWGRRWLTQPFYDRVFATMPEPLELVVAEREGTLVAGAFNVATPTHLFGRYWGCFEEHRFLHFNVCLYHSIDQCIARGLKVFEGGAGGEHKIPRGFEPAETYSSHLFLDPRLQAPFAAYLVEESAERERSLQLWRETSPVVKRKPQHA